MRSFNVVSGQQGLAQQFVNLRHDAKGGSFLLAHQQLGALALGTAPTNGQTITLTINGTAIVFTAVATIGTTAGNVLNPGTAAGFVANLIALITQPQTTTATGVALSAANQQLLSCLSWALSGTTITPSSNNTSLYAPLSSFTASTTVTSGSWTAQTMQLYVESGVVYVSGTRVLFTGSSTPTVTAPSSYPRIDVLTVDNSGTLAWTIGSESATPSAPTYPANKIALCELYNIVGETALYDGDNQQSGQGYIYNDVRPFLGERMNWLAFASDLVPDGNGTRNLGSVSDVWNNIYCNNILGNVVAYNYQAFIANGTWTKPSGLIGTEMVLIQVWGAGGGGGGSGTASSTYSGGGGGGAYSEIRVRASDLSATVTVTIGTAGNGGSAGDNNGTAGGNTTFGSYLTGYGGGYGAASSGGSGGGGGGGGTLGVGANASTITAGNGGSPLGGTSSIPDSVFGGGYGQEGISCWGGGGGGSANAGGASMYGGGGGAAFNNASPQSGGTSFFGGNGGNAASNSAGTNGTAPGGGGGGGATQNDSTARAGGNGARGECRVWVIT